MNFLEGDDVLTVSAALNLIDAMESDESGGLAEDDTASQAPTDAGDNNVSAPPSSPAPTKKKPRRVRRKRVTKPGYSTEQARRKRAELLELRSQVSGLERWLRRLERVKPNQQVASESRQDVDSSDLSDDQQQWTAKAMEEFQKRQESEQQNKKLKYSVEKQQRLNDAMLTVLQQKETLAGLDYVFNGPTKDTRANLRLDNTPVFMEQLSSRVSQLYHDCAAVFPKERLPTFGCRMEPTVDMYRGRMMEIVARAPVDCPMKQASDILWEELSTLRTYPDKSYRYMTAKGADAMAKGFDMTLRSRFGTTAVNGLQYMQRFEEAERVVQVRAYKLLLPTEGLHLRGHAWTIVSQSETDPVHQSDVQFYLQLFVETQEGFSAREKDVKYIEEIGLDAWSSKMRTYSVWLQDMMVEKGQELLVG